MLLGFWLGVIIERGKIRYQKHPNLWRVLAGGIVGIILLRKGMGAVTDALTPESSVASILRALIIGFYMTAIAPWALIKLKLARAESVDS